MEVYVEAPVKFNNIKDDTAGIINTHDIISITLLPVSFKKYKITKNQIVVVICLITLVAVIFNFTTSKYSEIEKESLIDKGRSQCLTAVVNTLNKECKAVPLTDQYNRTTTLFSVECLIKEQLRCITT